MRAIVLLGLLLLLGASQAWAQVCAAPGKDTTVPADGLINTYYPGAATTLSAGATSLTLGTRNTGGASTAIGLNDLVLVIQMQDGALNTSNNSNYGSGTGNGTGTTTMGNAGRYEFVRATSVTGTTVNFTPALTHSYVNAAATTGAGGAGQKRYQVIRVPQYAAVTLSGVSGPAWNGTSGGVVVADASGTLTLGNGDVDGQSLRSIFLGGRGFRGGAGLLASPSNSAHNSDDQQWRSARNADGSKGEGIAGTPAQVANKSGNFGAAVAAGAVTAVATGSSYPQGDRARGAPGNAGGGGTEGTPPPGDSQRNAGGGGGGNYAGGGLGGRPWDAPLNDTNGRGGASYAGSLGFNRILLGGGGGAGGTNNGTGENATYENSGIACAAGALCSSGASGGGIVILRARTFAGSGVIDVRGAHGYNVGQDAGGGGGAGGSVILQAREGGSATVDARGGDGGNAWASNGGGIANRHGPGGGGGGGFVAYSPSNFSVSATLTGGRAGRTSNGPTDTYGSNGNNGGLNGFLPPDVPGVLPGADCLPDLGLTKTNGVSTLNNGDVSNYVFTVTNTGGPSSGAITVVDVLPAGLTVPNGTVTLTGAQATNWSCNAASNVLTCTSTTVLATSASSVFGFQAQVATVANGSSVTNRARVGGGGDPNKATPTTATTNACTGNNTPAGCAIDVDTVNAPLLSLVKTDNVEAVVIGGTTTYQLTLSNTGAAPTTGSIRVIDVLPVGMAYTGATPFSSVNFTCTYTAGTRSFSCDRSTALANGSSVTLDIPITVEATATGALTNRAQVGGGGDPGKVTLPTVATATACPAPTSPATTNSNASTGCAADTDSLTEINLVLQKDDGQPFMPINGQTTYQFIVRNDGTADSSGAIQFRDVLPSPMNWPGSLTLAGPNAGAWTCTRESATVVSCTSSSAIAVGAQSQFSLVANVGAATNLTQYTNRARIRGGGDTDLPATLDNAAVGACTGGNVPLGCAIDLNTAQNAPQIRLAKSHPDPQAVTPGGTVTFNLVVSNSGGTGTGTTQVRVVEVLPPVLAYTGVPNFNSGGFACTHSAGTITCNRSTDIAAGSSATISFAVTVAASAPASTLTNRAQVAGGGDPQAGASSSVTANTAAECSANGTPYLGCATDPVPVVPVANLTINKTAPAANAATGSTIVYTIVVTNPAGSSPVANAVLRDPVVAGLQCSTATCTPSGGATCPAATGTALMAALQSAPGAPIASLPTASSVSVAVSCLVTATGQ